MSPGSSFSPLSEVAGSLSSTQSSFPGAALALETCQTGHLCGADNGRTGQTWPLELTSASIGNAPRSSFHLSSITLLRSELEDLIDEAKDCSGGEREEYAVGGGVDIEESTCSEGTFCRIGCGQPLDVEVGALSPSSFLTAMALASNDCGVEKVTETARLVRGGVM